MDAVVVRHHARTAGTKAGDGGGCDGGNATGEVSFANCNRCAAALPCSRLRLYSDKVVAKWTASGSSAGPVLVMCCGRAGVWGAVGTSVASLVDGGSLQAFQLLLLTAAAALRRSIVTE